MQGAGDDAVSTVVYSFGEFVLDVGEARLLQRDTTTLVDMQPKVYDALLFLVERAGRLVSREELLDGLWPDAYVGLDALTQVVRKVRVGLGDNTRTPSYIETVPKRGYRFVCPVERTQSASGAPSRGAVTVDAWVEPAPLRPVEAVRARVDDLAHLRALLAGGVELLLAGRFALGPRIGESTYHCVDHETGHPVAVAVLHHPNGATVERFKREARVLRTLGDDGIIDYVAHGSTPSGLCFLATRWVPGCGLEAWLSEQGAMTLPDFQRFATALTRAVACAHRQGVIHRGIRAANVVVAGGDPGAPVLRGFHFARQPADARVTETGEVVGTLGSIAPEQLEGAADVDARADVYGLGCLYAHVLTGEPAFGGSPVEIIRRVLSGELPPLRQRRPELPEALGSLVARMCARDRGARPADGAAVVSLLADSLGC